VKPTLKSELPQVLVVLALFAASAVACPRVPERLPVHWNLAGEVDRWGGRFEGLLLLPLIAAGVYLLLLLVPRIDPGRENYASFRRPWLVIRWVMLAILAGTHGLMIASALRGDDAASASASVAMMRWIPALVGASFVVIGNLLGKIRPNWFVGIRTPWTLSSKRSWARTHRVGGWVFIALGLLIVVGAFVRHPWLWGGIAAVGLVAVVGLVVYSWRVWRDDPDRVPPSGTLPSRPSERGGAGR
jgi:uncharacterized membrane protein